MTPLPLPSSSSLSPALSRRTLLAAGAAAGVAALAGCDSPTRPPAGQQSAPSAGVRPTYLPYDGVKPDLPAQNPNSINGFLTVPGNRPSVLQRRPNLTAPVTVMGSQSIFAPPAMAQNPFWQNLNDHFGVTFDITMVPGADYTKKFQAMIAGDDLPQLVRVPSVPKLDQVMAAKFADLTEFLAGDAVKDHPMLANIPSLTWNAALFNNKVMAVPKHLLPLGSRVEARTDILAKLGVEAKFTSATDFLDFCREVTDAKAQRWALVQATTSFTKQMCGVPNQWRVTDGAFTHEIETDEYRRWLELSAQLWSEKLIHPQAFNNPQVALLFQAGQFMLFEVGGAGFTSAMGIYTKAAPGLTVAPVVPPRYDGGGDAAVYAGSGSTGITAINKTLPKEQIVELLVLLDGLAAPFGTAEWVAIEFGKEGSSFNWVDGVPVLTDNGSREKVIMNYVPGSPMVMYSGQYPDVTRAESAYEAAVGATALPLPTNGLFAESASSAGAVLGEKINNAVLDVINGRAKVSDWGKVVADWRSSGGDKLREEYQQAHAATSGR